MNKLKIVLELNGKTYGKYLEIPTNKDDLNEGVFCEIRDIFIGAMLGIGRFYNTGDAEKGSDAIETDYFLTKRVAKLFK